MSIFRIFLPDEVTLGESGLLRGSVDRHSHLLPGVDDGFRAMDESLAQLALHEEAGVRELWLTPHVMGDIPNRTEDLKERFEHLKARYHGPLRLRLAAEYMMDATLLQRLQERDLLPYGERESCLLVETSRFEPPWSMNDILQRVRGAGLFPALAHPERYEYLKHSEALRLKDEGVLFQLNLFSLLGMYGPRAAKRAARYLEEGLYEYAGSDLHSTGAWREALTRKLPKKLLEPLRGIMAGQEQ